MFSRISKLTLALSVLASVISSCKKEDLQKPTPTPPPPTQVQTGSIRFQTNADPTGQPYHSSNLTAVVTIINDKNVEVVKEQMLTLNLNGNVTTSALELPYGSYQLTRFRLVYGSINTHFATPIAGSAKASGVQKPLMLPIEINAAGAMIPVEVLRVQPGERPAAFGYPPGAFDNGQEDANPYFKMKLRATVKIGDVVYDSIPAGLMLTTFTSNGESTTTPMSLKAGVNEITLLKAAVKFRFYLTKWGVVDDLTLERSKIDESTIYTMGGAKAAKLLQSEVTYKLVNGAYIAESKNAYTYDGQGRLQQVLYYQKKKDNTPFIAMKDVFSYSSAKVVRIVRYDENGAETGSTDFGYDQQGRVRSINNMESGTATHATVEYHSTTNPAIAIHYVYPANNRTMDYQMTLNGGNVIADAAVNSNDASEVGSYSFDSGINPYAHMNWPDLFLSRYSKNNITSQYKTYYGNYPAVEPFTSTYTYDSDGYPKEVIKTFKAYGTSTVVMTKKTVFTY